MNKIYLFFLLFFMKIIICEKNFCQIKLEIKLIFPKSLSQQKLNIRLENGKNFKDIKLDFCNNQIIIIDTFYSKYAAVEVFYPNEKNKNQPFYAGFFVSEKQATILFKENNDGENPIENYQVENALDMKTEDYRQLKIYVAEEEKDAQNYINNLKNVQITDSIINIAQAKADKYVNRQTDFFKYCSGSYYCLWYFKQYISTNNTIPSDSLLGIYQNAFSENMKNSFEGNEIVKIINGRSEKKYAIAPNFIATDINGHHVSLEMYRNSYVLLNFWASWCAPCVKELPSIREIRKKYSEKNLKIIFITQDKDVSAFSRAITKYEINFGTHIFSTADLINLYGAQAIPKTFLIDPNRVIIYTNQLEKDNSDLSVLSQLLAEKLKN